MDAEWQALGSYAFGLVATVLVACSGDASQIPGKSPALESSLTVRAIDLDAAAGRAPIAFRSCGDGFTARGQRHTVTVSTARVSIVPRTTTKVARAFELHSVINGLAGATTPFEATSGSVVSRRLQGAEERIENQEGQLEHSWVVSTRPPGSLTFRIEIDGYSYVEETDAGLRFVDPRSGVGIRYGHGTWVDANGSRTTVRARWTGRSIDLVLDEHLLASTAFPATLDPIIVVELEPDTPVLIPDLRGQGTAAVATSETTTLAAFRQSVPERGIYSVRIGPDGAPLDSCGVPVSTDPSASANSYGDPVVAYGGGTFLVVWGQQTTGCAFDIRARRLDASGTPIDAADLVVTPMASCTNSGEYVRVAFDGNRFLLAWVNYDTHTAFGATVDPDGTIGAAFPIATVESVAVGVAGLPGGGWMVAWLQPGPPYVFLTHIGPDGTILDPGTMLADTWLAGVPAIASSGTELVVTWAATGDVHAQRLDAAGNTIGGTIAVTADPEAENAPQVAWDGTAWFLVWTEGDSFVEDVHARRMSPTGALLGASDVLVYENVAAGSGRFVGPTTSGVVVTHMVFPDPTDTTHLLSTFRRYDSAGVALDAEPVPIVRCGNQERRPAVAWNGSEYLVVWEDDRSGPDVDIYGLRIAADGTVLDPIAIPISTAALAQEHPDVASDGASFFVVWDDYRAGTQRDIYGTRVGSDGVVAFPAGIPIDTGTNQEWEPAVGAGGGRFLVAWENGSNAVEARVLDTDGTPVTASFFVSPSTGYDKQPRVAFGGGNFIVSFEGSARRYDATGSSLDPTAISMTSDFAGEGGFATSDDSWLFAFHSGFPSAVSSRRVGFDGIATEPAPTVIHPLYPNMIAKPRVAWDGEQFLAVWEAPTTPDYAATHALYASRVTAETEPVDSTPIALTDGTVTASFGNVAAGPAGTFLVAFQQWEPTVPYVNYRVRALLVTIDAAAAGTECTSSTECRSGLCVDGVCCHVRCDDDCAACSVASGGSIDGTCTPVAAGPVCRPAAGECDVTDTCDGVDRACPPDEVVLDGTECAGGTCNGGVCVSPLPDARPPDAPWPDARPPDAAPPDGPPPDAASPVDAQQVDAFAPSIDAPSAQDAATSADGAAEPTDASSAGAEGDSGCGCGLQRRSRSNPGGILWLVIAVLVVLRRRPASGAEERHRRPGVNG